MLEVIEIGMHEPHLNIFHAYRGPTSSEEAATRQLEDNLTRALMVTLDVTKNSPFAAAIFETLHLPAEAAFTPYRCGLQVSRPSPDWPAPERRRLLVIHGGPDLVIDQDAGSATTGRSDAVIVMRDCVVAIESKLGNRVSQGQLDRHRATLDIQDERICDVTWTQLTRALAEVGAAEPSKSVAAFVAQQLEEYLRMNGYGGVSLEHFAFFATGPEDRDPLVKEGIQRALRELGTEVKNALDSPWASQLLNIMPQNREASFIIAPTTATPRPPHLTIAMHPSGLSFLANVELASAYGMFLRSWQEDPDGFIDVIKNLATQPVRTANDIPWIFGVTRRVRQGIRNYHYWSAVSVATETLAGMPPDLLRQFIDHAIEKPAPEGYSEGYPAITISKNYPAEFVLAKGDLAGALAADAQQLESFFNWIRHPIR